MSEASERRRRLESARRLARLTDSAIELPLLRVRVGADALLGLVPVVGDAIGAAIALYFPYTAWRMGAPRTLIGRMLSRLAVDAAIGSVPVLGDLADIALRANQRNLDLLEEWLGPQPATPAPASPPARRSKPLATLLAALGLALAAALLLVWLTQP